MTQAFYNIYKFVKISQNPIWISDTVPWKSNQSIDGGQTYKEIEDIILFGAYYFLGNSKAEHTRTVFNIADFMAEIGGFYTIVSGALMIIGNYMNT